MSIEGTARNSRLLNRFERQESRMSFERCFRGARRRSARRVAAFSKTFVFENSLSTVTLYDQTCAIRELREAFGRDPDVIGAGRWRIGLPRMGLIMIMATSNSLCTATRYFFVAVSLFVPGVAHSQASASDFEICQNLPTPLNTGLFSCSKIIGDQSLPSEIKLIALFRRASIYEIRQDYGKALSDLEQALKLGNVPPAFYALRSRIYRESGDKANAIKDLTHYMELMPNPPVAEYYSIANEYLNIGDYDHAINYYTKAIKTSNPDFAKLSMRARAYSLAGDNAKALQDLEAAHPLDVGTFNTDMARIFIHGGQLEEGMAMANEAIAHSNDYPFSYEGRGLLEEALGQKDKAIEDFRMALSVNARVRISGAGDEAAASLKRLGVSP